MAREWATCVSPARPVMISFGGYYSRDTYADIWRYLQPPVAFVTRARYTQSRILPGNAPRKTPLRRTLPRSLVQLRRSCRAPEADVMMRLENLAVIFS